MDRTVEYLLKKYETKQPGEEWNINTEVKYVKEYQYKQRLFLLDGIINNLHGSFKLNKPQKDRIKYLIQDLDFLLGRTTEEQYIVMIIIYVKLETNNNARPQHYYNLLDKYDLTMNTFANFLVKLNKHHINKIPLPIHY